jgi:hypothetical protein
MITSKKKPVSNFFSNEGKPRKLRFAVSLTIGSLVLFTVSMLGAKGTESLEQDQEDRVAEQVEGRIRGFTSVEKIVHEQILTPGDKDVAVINLEDEKTCTVVLTSPGFEIPTELGNFSNCPHDPAQEGITSARD